MQDVINAKTTNEPRKASRVRIKSIDLRPPREPLDQQKVTRYRQALRQGDVFPPIHVMKYGAGRYEVMDGYHRFHAHRLEGRKTIQIAVIIS